MRRYSEWKPSQFDTPGLSLPDRQDWFVVPVLRTRDATCLEESNFASALEFLSEIRSPEDYEVHSFHHWACGWFDIIIVRPGSPAEKVARDLADHLDDYPVLDEDDLSMREHERAAEVWRSCYSEKERINYIRCRRSDFDFRSMGDLMGCVRGHYFCGVDAELLA
jgi:hypothetical protein